MPARSFALQLLILAIVFLGGTVAGQALVLATGSRSALAVVIGVLAIPAAFLIGMQLWLGFALLGALWNFFRGRSQTAGGEIPAGALVFLPVTLVVLGFSGLLIALFGTDLGFLRTISLYLGVGVGYGLLCWRLARAGYLPFVSN